MAQCTASSQPKRRYPTQREAISAAMRASYRSGLGLRVYRCPTCHGYHLTRKKQWGPRNGTSFPMASRETA
jgi:hypothetical protein